MNNPDNYKICSLGENALTIDFGNEISVSLNRTIRKLSNAIEEKPFTGFIECVPAYSSLTIFYDLTRVRTFSSEFDTVYAFVESFVELAMRNLDDNDNLDSITREIPASFDNGSALDLDFVAATNDLSTEDVIEIFLRETYRVFMLGFLPGFAYMGTIDESIATPRRKTLRTRVPKGSIGIAGNQTGIYPLESPGGWQIIGRTDLELFFPDKDEPTLFRAGDLVKFIRV